MTMKKILLHHFDTGSGSCRMLYCKPVDSVPRTSETTETHSESTSSNEAQIRVKRWKLPMQIAIP